MTTFHITGGRPLAGEIRVSGSKNASLPMMAVAILTDEPVRLENVPSLADVQIMADLLARLGVGSSRDEGGRLVLHAVDRGEVRAEYELVRRMRAGFCVLGPLLARRGRAEVSLPGGCAIGDRPVDLHLAGLAALGADLRIDRGYVVGRAGRLRGTTVHLLGPRGPTVTGTANVLSAAVLADGETTLVGAAVEPEVVDLGALLTSMGARIEGLGTPTVRVKGVARLRGAAHRVIPDRIEAATLLTGAALTRGSVTLRDAAAEHLTAVIGGLRAAGCDLEFDGKRIAVSTGRRPRPLDLIATPYPGVPSDVQAQLTALLCLAEGRSTVCDRVFPGRFMHVAELNRLGARIERRDAAAVIAGVDRLVGAAVTATDLRASAALVLAGLAAEGETTVHAAEHLDRGYERLDDRLRGLGASIRRKE